MNGSGYCRSLAYGLGTPQIEEMIWDMVSNNAAYPLNMLQNNAHHETCATSCYNCLRHYGNMPYHGLLDWELGLSFLNVLVNPAFKCGLDGNFDVFGLREWKTSAGALADDMAKRFEGSDGAQRKDFEGIPAFKIRRGASLSPWILVRHPLWAVVEPSANGTIFARAQHAAESYDGMVPLSWDSFNLHRRPSQVQQWILHYLNNASQ